MCAAVTEGYWVSTVQIKIPRDGLGVVMVRSFISISLFRNAHVMFFLLVA